ncbi:hypothetical protein [Bartonella tamiae]|uniref:Uncharacterized protein n=1 Tax=Bartonella tamiae Th239 TaxID=1094558 RepID=J0ZPD8_9HYPH|nr:hypothetical protein [Bartonella tamiae]EJF90428.1 hypothetical protein ME5_00829 [Bartonella tamiae Th239]EJF93628.1 hypothetical protein MEG_01052 [Bartonella tamiae Th307]
MLALEFAIAASANFPILILSIFWSKCSKREEVIGCFLGLLSSVNLTLLSPAVWVDTFGFSSETVLFPYISTALFSTILGFGGVWFFTIIGKSKRATIDKSGFLAQRIRSETNI